MITSMDRSGWFGASDTSMVLAKNRRTKSWKQWWAVKLGEQEPDFHGSIYTEAGNKYEHPLLLSINENMGLDRQTRDKNLLLRVNYDGDFNGTIYEAKTHKQEKEFEVTRTYWRQAQVEMYAYQRMQQKLELPPFRRLYIVSYALFPDEYFKEHGGVEIDFARVKFHEIKYDRHFIKDEYLPALKELARALRKGKFPS